MSKHSWALYRPMRPNLDAERDARLAEAAKREAKAKERRIAAAQRKRDALETIKYERS